MSFIDLVVKTRSCRRFEQKPLPQGFLDYLIKAAGVCPSTRNAQPLKYITIDNRDFMKELYPHLRWAGSLKDWDGPSPDERPVAYVAVILDKNISTSPGHDVGIVAQTMQLASMDKGIASCMIGAFPKNEVREVLSLDEAQEILLILALGYPKEERVLVDVKEDGVTAYYRDEKGVHYIPKRTPESLLIKHI